MSKVPVQWPNTAETCPACRRRIPGPISHPGPGPYGFTYWAKPAADLIKLCPIDGPLGQTHAPRPRAVSDLRAEASHLASALVARRDRGWAKMISRGLPNDDDDFVVSFGDSLAVLLRHGPLNDLDAPRADVEQLLVDTVAMWPARPRS